MSEPSTLRGVVHGNVIQFDQELGFPEGIVVSVTVESVGSPARGEGLQKSFGAWSNEAEQVDEFLGWNRQQRKSNRSE